MRAVRALSDGLGRLLRPVGVCGAAGVLVGMVAGLLLVLVHIFEDSHTMSDMEALLTWILLAALGWLVLWFVFVALMRWTLGSVIVPTLVNAVLVTGVTVLILRTYDLWEWAWVIGSLVGLIIGALLCLFYSRVVAR